MPMSGERIQIPLDVRSWPSLIYIGCWLGSFVIFQGTLTSIVKESYSFVILLGVGVVGAGVDSPPPPLDLRMDIPYSIW